MKKALIVVTIVLILSAFAASAERTQEMIYYRSDEVKEFILFAENCTVEFEHSQNMRVECPYGGNAVDISYNLYGQTLQVNIRGNNDQMEEREVVRFTLPSSEIDLFIINAINSTILIDSVMERSSYIAARNSSLISLDVRSSQPHQIGIVLQDSSTLLFAVDESLENIEIDAIATDDTNHLRMGAAYPDFYRQGEYHYERGSKDLVVHIRMSEGCSFELYSDQ